MSVEIKRKGNESTEGLLRRFREKVQRSRVLIQSKKSRFIEKKKSKRQTKQDALSRKRSREKREYLIKIGKITDTPRNGFRKR